VRAAVLLGLVASFLLPSSSPATVAEQRARLPPPATCTDPVEGIWRAHYYASSRAAWRIFSLEIHRTKGSPTELEGSVTNHGWNGGPDHQEPGACNGSLDEWQIKMDGRGTFSDGKVRFGGTRWWLDKQICGKRTWGPGSYNLDQFAGTIDPSQQEFQSVGNDGGALVNVPMVFRRVHCFDEGTPQDQPPSAPSIVVTPPSYLPGRHASGCCGSTER